MNEILPGLREVLAQHEGATERELQRPKQRRIERT
jgi:hypothetical protein